MTLTSYRNAGLLDDAVKSKQLTSYERSRAEHLRQAPSFLDWTHYMLFVGSAALAGPNTEYGSFY